MKKIVDSFKHAINGIEYSFITQRNIRIHFFIALIVLLLGIVVKLEYFELLIILLTINVVIAVEMINTAIEKTIDLITEEYNLLAKIAKDVAAGAVLISAIISIIIGVLIFYNKIF
ncbi:MAG: diacylglycerol kinase family protein [Eubacteriaceae bacterium]